MNSEYRIDPLDIIRQFYTEDSSLFQILVRHSQLVSQKSLEIADTVSHLNPDRVFIKNAAMLHDIGIYLTHAPSIDCTGDSPYICHGILGRKILDSIGLPSQFGLVCERHTGAGITRDNVILNDLPLPKRDMVPVTLEEKIICAADKFFSKEQKIGDPIPTTTQVVERLKKISPGHAQRFASWAALFKL